MSKNSRLLNNPRFRSDVKVGGYYENMVVINGVRAQEGQVPWQVLIENMATKEICGGSVINLRFILTAAHCVDDFMNKTSKQFPYPKNVISKPVWKFHDFAITQIYVKSILVIIKVQKRP